MCAMAIMQDQKNTKKNSKLFSIRSDRNILQDIGRPQFNSIYKYFSVLEDTGSPVRTFLCPASSQAPQVMLKVRLTVWKSESPSLSLWIPDRKHRTHKKHNGHAHSSHTQLVYRLIHAQCTALLWIYFYILLLLCLSPAKLLKSCSISALLWPLSTSCSSLTGLRVSLWPSGSCLPAHVLLSVSSLSLLQGQEVAPKRPPVILATASDTSPAGTQTHRHKHSTYTAHTQKHTQ